MEPDLDRLLHPDVTGSYFPQFSEEWKSLCERVSRDLLVVTSNSSQRCRVALNTRDPARFASCFVALSLQDVDLFLFNPSWAASETSQVQAVAKPSWVISDDNVRQFGEPTDSSNAEIKGLRIMIPTGGTSGSVKFAIHDWSTLSAAAYGLQMHFGCELISSHCVLPLYHVSGFMQMIRAILTRGCVYFSESANFGNVSNSMTRGEESVRFLSLVPTQLERLLRSDENMSLLHEYDAIFVGGGPVPVQLLERCRETGIPLAPTYGMTETAAQVATQKPSDFLKGESGQGHALPHLQIEVLDMDSEEMADAKQVGRIRLRGTSLFHGYFGEPAGQPGYFDTSDLGQLDESGKLSVFGRSDQIIISGGEKIHPREVEEAIEKTNLVEDVAVLGVDDPEWGQKVVAGYVPKGDFVTESGLKSSLEGQLSTFKIPKSWKALKALPRNEAGKLDRKTLQQLVN